MGKLTPKERVLRVMRKQEPDKTPFTIYQTQINTQCFVERNLRNRGMCILHWQTASYRIFYKGVDVKNVSWITEDGTEYLKTLYSTPYGDMYTLKQRSGITKDFTYWTLEHMFKGPEDYKKIHYMITNAVVIQELDAYKRLTEEFGDDVLLRDSIMAEPLQNLISREFMDPETFSYEWYDNRDEILKLEAAFKELNRKIYNILAESPSEIIQYGYNATPEIIGPKVFEEYYLPNYYEAAEILHKKNKIMGTHLDSNNASIMHLIEKSALDYVESYDPLISPSVEVAMRELKSKVICINWPSGWHLNPLEEVPELTKQLIQQADPTRFVIGISENVPPDRKYKVFSGIMDGIDQYWGIK